MARLPTPGGDNGNWGEILNEYLAQALKPDGTIKDNAVTANVLAPNSVTNAALASNAVNAAIIADGSITEVLFDTNVQAKLNASAGLVLSTDITDSTATGRSLLTATDTSAAKIVLSLTSSDVGLSNVNNTSDASKNSATVTLTNKTLTAPVISSISNTGTLTLPTSTDTLIGRATTDMLTNKRLTKRSGTSSTPGATPALNTDNYDVYTFTGLSADITSMTTSLSGTPNLGDEILLGLKDNGIARAITWGASFQPSGVASLLTTTVASKQHWVKLLYDGSKWTCLAVDAIGY